MMCALTSLALGVVATTIGTIAGLYIYDRWFKQ